MNNQSFLRQALEQSFQKPIMTDYNNIDFIFCHDSSGCFIMGDKSECQFAPCLISGFDVKSYINTAVYDVKHSSALNHEFELFKHYFEENIIIEENTPTMQSLRLWLDLTSVSRQAAQKKRVIATLMPPRFKETISNMEKGYREALKKIRLCEQENLDAVEIALISDFTASYRKACRSFRWGDMLFWTNKSRMRRYLAEAYEIIKEEGTLPAHFELSHTFSGNGHKYFGRYADSYRSDMLSLANKIQKMTHNNSLMELAALFIKTPKLYPAAFQTFCNQRRAPNLHDIVAIKQAAQVMFNEFTKLCYLEGVRKAFEINYLDECPSPQNPPLPSVSPNEEIGKIRNIVEESRLIDYQKTQTGRFYHQALQNYRQAREKIDKILIDYIGIPSNMSA